MKRILYIISFFVLLFFTWCTQIDNNVLDGQWMIYESNDVNIHTYSAEVQSRSGMIGEDINVYDENWDLVFSLVDNDDPQYFFEITWKYLIIDLWTGSLIKNVRIYDVELWKNIFDEEYVFTDWSLELTTSWLLFFKKQDPTLAKELPICENEYDNWYISLYSFDFSTLKVEEEKEKRCLYFE